MHNSDLSVMPMRQKKRKRSCLGCLGRLFLMSFWAIPLVLLAAGVFLLGFVLFPPFGQDPTAKVLLIGLDDKPRQGGAQRSDTIILYSARLRDGGATLISIPRDARVRIPGYRHFNKINAAYALDGTDKLKETLAQPDLIGEYLPYHVVFDSETVVAVVDALGGIEIDVPRDMKYDDNWGNLHIDLKAGRQMLDGEQVKGYLRWRKNNHGRGASDDFFRTERQRQVLVAIKDKLSSWQGMLKIPAVYEAFKAHTQTNLSFTQFVALGWASREMRTDAVPGTPHTIGGVSYVLCDWDDGRARWSQATQ